MAARAHRLTVEWLLRYAPELNDIEQVWRDLKTHHLARRTFQNIRDLEQTIGKAVKGRNSERNRNPLAKQRISASCLQQNCVNSYMQQSRVSCIAADRHSL
jgi:DDE superfamily endonuclease